MMKQRLVQIRKKLASRRAETLAELLVSVLVISLGLTMFATALMSARRMLTRSDMVFQSYYTGRNLLEDEADEAKDDTAEIVLEKGTSTQNLAAPEGSRSTGHTQKGRYQAQLYSEVTRGGDAEAAGTTEKNYRYQRIN